MNSIAATELNQDVQENTQEVNKAASLFVEVSTILAMFTVTSAVVIMLSLTWVN